LGCLIKLFIKKHKYINTYIHTQIHTNIHTYTHAHTYIHTHIRTYVHTYTHIHTYIIHFVCMYIYIFVYKLARNKTKKSLPMTTLQRPDGSFQSDLNETVQIMTDYLIPKDEQIDDTDCHKQIRAQTERPILTAD
jgi:hypothetical protein